MPVVNVGIIVLNVIVFVLFQQCGTNETFNNTFSAIPNDIVTGENYSGPVPLHDGAGHVTTITLYATPVSVYLQLFTSMFMHGGFAHIGGNMLYLWIFGDNLEDVMGHFKYLLFYLLCGIVADLSHAFCTVFMHLNPLIPSLGASGAISGVLGGYVLLFPTNRVTVLFGRQLMQVPAYVALGLWILLQVVESSGVLGGSSDSGGVAYAAHIGGFLAGIAMVHLFTNSKPERQERTYY